MISDELKLVDHTSIDMLNYFEDKRFGELFTEALRALFDNSKLQEAGLFPPSLTFPFAWSAFSDEDGQGGPIPKDPVTVYVQLPFDDSSNATCLSCSLEGVVDDLIDGMCDPDHPKVVEVCGKISGRLRELANKLDRACGVGT